MRNYSVLTSGETIQVAVSGEQLMLDIVEVTPGDAVTLYGDLDLAVGEWV